MAKNSTDQPPASRLGCADYRLGLVLSALRKQLADGPGPEEKKKIRAEIESIEKKMGL